MRQASLIVDVYDRVTTSTQGKQVSYPVVLAILVNVVHIDHLIGAADPTTMTTSTIDF